MNKHVLALVSGIALGAAGAVGTQSAMEKEPEVLGIEDAVLRGGAGIVETVCAEAQAGQVRQCYKDSLTGEDLKARLEYVHAKALPRWKSHRAAER